MQKQANAEQKESEAQDNAKVESRPDMSDSNDNTQAQKDEQETDTQGEPEEEPVQGRSDKLFPDEVDDTEQEQEQEEIKNSGDTQGGEFGDINTATTQRSLDESIEDLTNTYKDQVPTQYVTIPNMVLDKVVVDFNTIKTYLDEHFVKENTTESSNKFLIEHTRRFNEFKKSSNKEVNYLVKEFEMKKSADSYSRQATAKTGMLDTSKLHTYMYNEDIFRKVTTIPDGKNHGLIFVLDWSGSMNNILEDTLKQLFQLVWFCKKTQIPYEVYAFTNDSWQLNKKCDEDQPYTSYRNTSSDLLVAVSYTPCMLRNRKSGKTYGLNYSNCSLKLIECIKDDLPNVSFIAFRVVERGGMRYVWTQYGMETYPDYEVMKEQIKKGNLSLTLNSYDKFFMIPQNHLSVDSDQLEQVEEGASKGEVSKAFRKMFKNKKTNKFMLSEFAKAIA